jgi:hypothetical protein
MRQQIITILTPMKNKINKHKSLLTKFLKQEKNSQDNFNNIFSEWKPTLKE